jgi:AcrR family transcriptional regulator
MRAISSRARAIQPGSRDPARTRERILAAALKEFASRGFAGARVDRIASGASINKRMLYHYFGDKEALFREVLRQKMAERKAWKEVSPDDPAESLPYWFELARKDMDWVRLLEWEALQFADRRLIDESRRIKSAREAVKRIALKQKLGHLRTDMDAGEMLLGMIALSWFPLAFPQLTRLITGHSALDSGFVKTHHEFLRRVAVAFRGAPGRARASNGSGSKSEIRMSQSERGFNRS